MVAGLIVYPHLFSTQETIVSDLPTSDSPRDFPLPLGRRTSRSRCIIPVGGIILPQPISLRRERKFIELLPRHQQCTGKSCSNVRCLTIPVPCVKPADTVGDGGVRSLNL